MSFNYGDLPQEQQQYLASRFDNYGLDPELAYNHLIPIDVKLQGADFVEEFMRNKHISHIYPQSSYPHLADNLDNVFLEDPSANLSRGADIASPDEIFNAQLDNASDAWDMDFNDNGILDQWEAFY
ncbi:hypothetical protein IQE94_02090 [Synechocystis sp. PCC 7339]|uniref:hypothetical protein n=1 Tax=unclassified Synechocystis TaxID=2640012 RepID=UPI001BB00DD2|nr:MULTISPECIES: hypothetical protein [unclassified Synechocystis]QUS60972.1 hypothetical protein HTZ78_10040 [Synechocystis sp. PCC 7338]UAJ73155.1 hypothetical protein IQE94_02090 [Synechocystis sp. PCC 7339]